MAMVVAGDHICSHIRWQQMYILTHLLVRRIKSRLNVGQHLLLEVFGETAQPLLADGVMADLDLDVAAEQKLVHLVCRRGQNLMIEDRISIKGPGQARFDPVCLLLDALR